MIQIARRPLDLLMDEKNPELLQFKNMEMPIIQSNNY